MITTKKGKVGTPALSYSMSGTFTARPRYTDKSIYLMNSKERIAYSREIMEKDYRILLLRIGWDMKVF